MKYLTEKCFYICLVITLVFLAILLPLVIMQGQMMLPHYIYLGPAANFTGWKKYDHIVWGFPPEMRSFEDVIRGKLPPHKKLEQNNTENNTFVFLILTEIIGKTPNKTDVDAVKLTRTNGTDLPLPVILIVGGLVGSDRGSIFTTNNLMDISKNADILDSFDLNFIPNLDPDGYNQFHNNKGPPIELRNASQTDWTTFKNYFIGKKNEIKAVFLLTSSDSQLNKSTIQLTVPQKFVDEAPQRFQLFQKVVKNSWFFSVFPEYDTESIGEWLVEETLPTPVLVVNVKLTTFGLMGRPDSVAISKRLYDLIDNLHFNKTLILYF